MTGQMVSFAAALGELDIRPGDRVLILLPEGAGFTEALTVTVQRGAVPLPGNPLTPAEDIPVVAVEAAAHLVLLTLDRKDAVTGLAVQDPVVVDGPEGPWAVALRLRWPMRLWVKPT